MLEMVDGQPPIDGPITKETQSVEVNIRNHIEELQFDIIHAPWYPLFLGIHWLETHDPNIEWSTCTVSFPSHFCHYSCFRHKWNGRCCDEIIGE